MRIGELETPALIVDLEIMQRNLERVAAYAARHDLRLRPHTKTHKIPALARKQLDLGATGLTVAKTTEAEVMLRTGAPDLLIAYPVVGDAKLRRLVEVARQTSVTVAVDSIAAARGISEAAVGARVQIGILAEIDVGLHRVGVPVGEPLRQLALAISRLPGLRFEGIAFYPGHIKRMDPLARPALAQVQLALAEATAILERAGLEIRIVSGGSTPALYYSHTLPALNEIRPGTYIFNDRNTVLVGACGWEDCAAFILTTVVSTSVSDRVILDGGSKTFSSDRCAIPEADGFGKIREAPDALFEKMNEEHGFVDIRNSSRRRWKVGERVQVIPNHICVAVNLHETIYGYVGEEIVEVWPVEARGKLQ